MHSELQQAVNLMLEELGKAFVASRDNDLREVGVRLLNAHDARVRAAREMAQDRTEEE